MNTEEREKKRKKKLEISIGKRDIGFLNFFRTIKFVILATLQNFVINNLSNLRPRTKYGVRFLSANSHKRF